MKVQVNITNSNKAGPTTSPIDATVGPADTVLNVQELIASVTKTFSFPDQKLLFNGKVLPSAKRLSDCGVKEGDVIEFVFEASEQTLVKQLSDLLGKQAVSPEELGLLYSYRYANSFEDALKALGHADAELRERLCSPAGLGKSLVGRTRSRSRVSVDCHCFAAQFHSRGRARVPERQLGLPAWPAE
jgi:hypothetical protein